MVSRDSSGSTLVLILAILLGIILLLFFFGLGYTRMLGSNQEQKTAIEAAALAAAKSLSKVVIEDPHFGFVGISDHAPVGKLTAASDQYGTQMQSINTIFATIRLDMIIADQINAPLVKQFAKKDYDYALIAAKSLVVKLTDAVSGVSSATDIDGNPIDPYQEATDAYQMNKVRMEGDQSNLVGGSLKLTIGCVKGLPTNSKVATPSDLADVDAASQSGGYYNAYMNIPYDGVGFVFAGIGKDIALTDFHDFQENPAGLPYFVPTVVKVEADQWFEGGRGAAAAHKVHAVACAQTACNDDPRPAPGVFSLSYLGGRIDELSTLKRFFTDAGLNAVLVNTYSASIADYPETNSKLVVAQPLDIIGSTPSVAQIYNRAFYDWLRQCGTALSISAVTDMVAAPALADVPKDVPFMTTYRLTPDGGVKQNFYYIQKAFVPNSHQQLVGINMQHEIYAQSTGYTYDVVVADQVYSLGRNKGGKHAGTPIPDQRLIDDPEIPGTAPAKLTEGNVLKPQKPMFGWDGASGAWAYGLWKKLNLAPAPFGGHNKPETLTYLNFAASPGELRPTYTQNGNAVDFAIHRVVKELPYDN